jgi:hypothetical protein
LPKFQLLDSDERIAETLAATHSYLATDARTFASLNESVIVMRILEDLLPQDVQRMFSGHGFPLAEAYSELEAVIQLAARGFYRQAFAMLRVVLELGILSVYIDANDQSHIDVKEWLAGGRTPHPKQMLDALAAPPFQRYFAAFDVVDDVLKQYERLNGFVHVKGSQHSSRALNRTNVRAFEEKALRAIAYHSRRAVTSIAVLHIIKYPVALQETPMTQKFGLNTLMGGFLEPGQAEFLRDFVGPDRAAVLQAISDDDEWAVGAGEDIRSRPDLTDDDWKAQIFEQDCSMIKGMGFAAWLASGLAHEPSDEAGVTEERKAMVADLERWARENDVMDAEGARRYREAEAERSRAEIEAFKLQFGVDLS